MLTVPALIFVLMANEMARPPTDSMREEGIRRGPVGRFFFFFLRFVFFFLGLCVF